LEIWRIEDFEVVKYPDEKYGKFYEGDSYIILKTVKSGSGFSHHVHYLIGSESSQDEYGTAAIKAVELDDYLGGAPVQHRETQGHEGNRFLSYFKKGLTYMRGGIKSGFDHVDPDAEIVKRLYKLQGKRNIRMLEVPLDASLLNRSESWLLDGGKGQTVFVFNPAGTSPMRKFKAIQHANAIRDDEHAGNAEIEQLDELNEQFFETLGAEDPGELGLAEEESDGSTDGEPTVAKLFKVSDASGELDITEVAEAPFKYDMLDQSDLDIKDCFVLNSGCGNGIFVWTGKEATKDEKAAAIKIANDFLDKEGLPTWTKVTRVIQESEPSIFKQYFEVWREEPEGSSSCPAVGGRRYPASAIAEWDVSQLHAENRRRLARGSAGTAIGFCPGDDGSGSKQVWRIENFEMVECMEDEEKFGKFFGGDSYVILYTYEKDGREKRIIYFWQGNESSQDEKAASAIEAVKLDNQYGGAAVQVRVVQGQEPRHFIKMFAGKMVVYTGGKASGFKNVHDHDTYDADGTRLFRVRGTCAQDIRVVQIQPEEASSLNSEDVFVLETPTNTWIWSGEAASEDELEAAKNVSGTQISPDREAEVLQEGSEPEEFWEALGGKGEYSKMAAGVAGGNRPVLEPRLFACTVSEASGKVRAIEIMDFEQADLREDEVMLLDSGAEIYAWVGKKADLEQSVLNLAKEYLRSDPTWRDETNTLIFTVKQGNEPSSFTCCFPAFEPFDLEE